MVPVCLKPMPMLQLPEFILKNYGESKSIGKADIWYIAEKRCVTNCANGVVRLHQPRAFGKSFDVVNVFCRKHPFFPDE
jgi:hypothetical protein